MSLLEKILAADDLKSETMRIEEWDNAELQLNEFTAAKRSIIEAMYTDESLVTKDPYRAMAKTLVLGVSDTDGNDVFTDETIDRLLQKNPLVIQRIFERINALNGLGSANEQAVEKN